MSLGGDGSDPFDLDPFGDDPTPSAFAFAHQAAEQADEVVAKVREIVEESLVLHAGLTNPTARSARKSSVEQVAAIEGHQGLVQARLDIARQDVTDSGNPNICPSAGSVVEAFSLLRAAAEKLILHTVPEIGHPDTPPFTSTPAALPVVEPAMQASHALHVEMRDWVRNERGTESGKMLVAKVTAGVGKTHAMIEVAIEEQLAGQRVIFANRVREHLIGDNPELLERFIKRSPLGKTFLPVIVGRGEENCKEWETVDAVMKHGYTPGQAVCPKCDYHPDHAKIYGWSPCDYYAQRMRAHNLAQGAHIGSSTHYPLVLTTHASINAAHETQGGRWGGYWPSDLMFMDEDPTGAFEIDIQLTQAQCMFRSGNKENRHAHAIAVLYTYAFEIAGRERAIVAATGFSAPGTNKRNTHPIHTSHGSVYVGRDLIDLLERAAAQCRVTMQMPELARVLCDVADSQGFYVKSGELINVKSIAAINALDVPPKALATISGAIHTEMEHETTMRRIAYKKIRGHEPPATSLAGILEELRKHTEVEPLSYASRLECTPGSSPKDDEWSLVTRQFTPLANHKSRIVVGDAYAQKEHYEQLFLRDAHMIEKVASLHPDTRVIRLQYDKCNIGSLEGNGYLGEVLSIAENRMREMVSPGDRVLIYGHLSLKDRVSPWMEGVAEQLGVPQWKYEHWWGGRGKDQYNGWEHIFCISDPIQNLWGIEHVANARAFRTSLKATDDDEKLEHGRRLKIADAGRAKNNTLHALGASHPRIVLEHERMNVAEVTQAIHRPRPVHNATNIVIIGAPELATEIVAQTINVTESERIDSQGHATLIAPARDDEGFPMLHAFVTTFECGRLIRAIINHYGVFSSWFTHALLAAPSEALPFEDGLYSGALPFEDGNLEIIDDYERTAVATPISLISNRSNPGLTRSSQARTRSVPEPDPASLAAGSASLKRRSLMGVIDRVWDPPVKWQVDLAHSLWPVREAIKALRSDRSLVGMPAPTPSWRRSGRPPALYYDPTLLGGSFHAGIAAKAYLDIVETQYGPEQSGRLYRPKFNPVVPPGMNTPF